jgi:mono/diheme cytochrome c family protein
MAYFTNPRAVLPWSPMASYKYLSTDEIEALAAFLQRLNGEASAGRPQPAAPAEMPETRSDLPAYNEGRDIYFAHCVGCHGEFGNGGGPVGHLLSPEPRDFTDTLWFSKQIEAYLFAVTTDGKPNTAMPAFNETLSARERALVVRYIEYFADPVARQRMELGFVPR